MDLRQLRYFTRVADTGSFSRAAQKLHVTQSALGLQIRKLEDELGAPLFLRHARGVIPTEAGLTLRSLADSMLDAVEFARQRVRDVTGQPRGPVTVGMIGSMGMVIVPELVRRCRARFPGIDLTVEEGVSAGILETVESGRNLLGLSGIRRSSGALVFEPLVVEAPVFVGPKSDSLASRKPIRFAAATRLPLVLPTSTHRTRQLIDEVARRIGAKVNVVIEIDSMSLRKELVLNKAGYTILPYTAVHREVTGSSLFSRPISDPQIPDTVYIVHDKSRPLPLCATVVRGLIRELAQEAIADGRWYWQLPKRN